VHFLYFFTSPKRKRVNFFNLSTSPKRKRVNLLFFFTSPKRKRVNLFIAFTPFLDKIQGIHSLALRACRIKKIRI